MWFKMEKWFKMEMWFEMYVASKVFSPIKVRVENIQEPSDHIEAVLGRVKPEYISKTYQVESWSDSADFMEQVARRMGRLLKVSHVFSSNSTCLATVLCHREESQMLML